MDDRMKKSTWFLLACIIIIIVCCSFVFVTPEESCEKEYTIAESYVYPVIPGTPEWNDFDTVYEMLEACQIPEDMVENMTTEALVKTVLHYPLLKDLMAGSSVREGFEVMLSNFNGFQELSKRSDASDYLHHEYLALSNTDSQAKLYDMEQQLKENLVEILLQQPEFGGEMKRRDEL